MIHLVELTSEEKEQAKDRIEAIFEAWFALIESHELNSQFKNLAYLSPPLVSEIVYRYLCDVRRIKQFHKSEIENINEFKIAGYLSYWICKIRPVQLKEQLVRLTRTQNLLNELLAFHLSIGRINLERKEGSRPLIDFDKSKDKSSSFVNELFYTMKYRTTSGDTLSQIYRYTDLF